MLLDISPLRKHRDYRCLFIGQLISIFGSMITYMALPFQIYQLTHSTLSVGVIGLIELISLLPTAFLVGVFADAIDRKKLLILSEFFIMLMVLILAINANLSEPKNWIIYCVAGIISALNGFHRPALDSLGPRLVDKFDIPAYSALSSFKNILGAVAGPAIGGLCPGVAVFGKSPKGILPMNPLGQATFDACGAHGRPRHPHYVTLRPLRTASQVTCRR